MTEPIIYAAPLQGYTECAWRNAHLQTFGGIDTYYTPFIRLEKNTLRNKDKREIQPERNPAGKVIPQIIAATPTELAVLAEYLGSLGYQNIDFNMGCPFPLIVNKQKGSGLLPHPDMIAALLDEMNRYPEMSFSVKMRLGHTVNDEWKAIIPLLNRSCIKQIVLHPRIGKQQYKGCTDLDAFQAFYEQCELPLVYNGDLCSIADATRILERFPKLKGIMLGRGLLANPSLATEIRNRCSCPESELFRKVHQMHELIVKDLRQSIEGGEAQLLQKLKTMWEYLLPQLDKKPKKAILKARNLQEYCDKVSEALR